VADCRQCGDKPLGSDATELVTKAIRDLFKAFPGICCKFLRKITNTFRAEKRLANIRTGDFQCEIKSL
jgi:hypothetical protein